MLIPQTRVILTKQRDTFKKLPYFGVAFAFNKLKVNRKSKSANAERKTRNESFAVC